MPFYLGRVRPHAASVEKRLRHEMALQGVTAFTTTEFEIPESMVRFKDMKPRGADNYTESGIIILKSVSGDGSRKTRGITWASRYHRRSSDDTAKIKRAPLVIVDDGVEIMYVGSDRRFDFPLLAVLPSYGDELGDDPGIISLRNDCVPTLTEIACLWRLMMRKESYNG